MKKLLFMTALVMLSACTNPETASQVLRSQGFTNIEITGYDAFACSDDDVFHTGFVAVSATGQVVSGTVCSGWLKGSTIRFK